MLSPSSLKGLPPFVLRKLQRIAVENEMQVGNFSSNRWITICDSRLVLLSQSNRTWVYSGGSAWILCSDGDLFAEPVDRDSSEMSFDNPNEEIWVITLDDRAETLTVGRLILPLSEDF